MRVLETAQRRASQPLRPAVSGLGLVVNDATTINPRFDFLSANILVPWRTPRPKDRMW